MSLILSLILAMGMSLPIDPSHTQEKNSSGNEIFDQWGDLLVEHFNLEDMKVITRIIWCESRGKATAKNPNGSAGGLFQIIRKTARWVAPKVGQSADTETMSTGIRFNPYWNTRMAAFLFYETSGGIKHWNESKSCWGKYA